MVYTIYVAKSHPTPHPYNHNVLDPYVQTNKDDHTNENFDNSLSLPRQSHLKIQYTHVSFVPGNAPHVMHVQGTY